MNLDRIDPRAVERVSGPAWGALRASSIAISRALLDVSPRAVSVLTTIYVKFQIRSDADAPVFAVVWLKTSRQIIVGLTLPDTWKDDGLQEKAPAGTKYHGLTRYFVISPGMSISAALGEWAAAAFEHASAIGAGDQ